MKIEANKIGFDLDGVIADTAEAFMRLACERHDYCGYSLEDITSFQVEDCLDIPTAFAEKIFYDILLDSIKAKLQPMPGAIKTINKLAEISDIIIITARPMSDPVADWLDLHFPQATCKKINLIAMGDHDGKAQHIIENNLQYFVDDRAETCVQLRSSGIEPLVFSQPWNKSHHNLSTVNSWDDIEQLIQF